MNATAHVFGTGKRPDYIIGPDASNKFDYYKKDMKVPGAGYTMRPYYEGVKNK